MKNIRNIVVTAKLLDAENKTIDGLPVSLMFLDVTLNRWLLVARLEKIAQGIVNFQLNLSKAVLSNTELKIVESLDRAALPIFRLNNTFGKAEELEVFTTNFSQSINNTLGRLTIDFGNNWIYPKTALGTSEAGSSPLTGLPFFAARLNTAQTTSSTIDTEKFVSKETFQAELGKATTELQGKEAMLNETQKELQNARKQVVERETTIAMYETQIAEIGKMTTELQGKEAMLSETQKELQDARVQVQERESTIAAYEAQITALENELEGKTFDDPGKSVVPLSQQTVPIANIVNNLMTDAAAINTQNISNGYKISNLSLNIKGLYTNNDGKEALTFLTPDETKELTGNPYSEMQLNLVETPATSPGSIVVPRLLGLSETAVIMLLEKQNLKLNPVYQQTSAYPIGQAFKQVPGPGDMFETLDSVTVIFAK
jgi:hypothetical protein